MKAADTVTAIAEGRCWKARQAHRPRPSAKSHFAIRNLRSQDQKAPSAMMGRI
jgi:hypothetical protein